MNRGGYRVGSAAALLLCCVTAQADSPFQTRLHAAIADGSALAERRQQLEAAERALLSEKQALDAVGDDVGRRQAAMNGLVDAHNQQVSAQQQALAKNRSECSKDNLSGGNQLNACNVKITALNKKTEDVDQANLPMQQEEIGLELDYAVYNLQVADWNYREESAVTELNMIYLATNAWLDSSYSVLVADEFQLDIQHTGSERYCSSDALPSGHITQQQLAKGADYLLACFRRVAKAQAPSAAR